MGIWDIILSQKGEEGEFNLGKSQDSWITHLVAYIASDYQMRKDSPEVPPSTVWMLDCNEPSNGAWGVDSAGAEEAQREWEWWGRELMSFEHQLCAGHYPKHFLHTNILMRLTFFRYILLIKKLGMSKCHHSYA